MKYEINIDEAEARALVYDLSNDGSDLEKAVADQLASQLPPAIPAPTRIGAVVRTEIGEFVRADGSGTPWIRAIVKGLFTERPDWLADDQIGRITEVLSEGVDL